MIIAMVTPRVIESFGTQAAIIRYYAATR